MKINSFHGVLTDISAKIKSLASNVFYRQMYWLGDPNCFHFYYKPYIHIKVSLFYVVVKTKSPPVTAISLWVQSTRFQSWIKCTLDIQPQYHIFQNTNKHCLGDLVFPPFQVDSNVLSCESSDVEMLEPRAAAWLLRARGNGNGMLAFLQPLADC